jgi:hypothetical protein
MIGMNLKQKLVVVTMDLLLLLELGYSVYRGQQPGADLTMVFLQYFVPSVIVTVMVARYFIRRWQEDPPATAAAAGPSRSCLTRG